MWFAETYGGMLDRGLRGDMSPPAGFPPPGTLSGPEVEELYATEAIRRREDLGTGLLIAFNETYRWLNQVLAAIVPGDWEKPCYHTNGIRTVEWFPGVVIQELAIHEWDIRSTIEPSPPLSEDSLAWLVERVSSRRRPWTLPFLTDRAASGSLRYRFELTGAAGGRRDIVVEGDKPRLETEAECPANLFLRGDASSFILIMYDRLTLKSAIDIGRFAAEGDLELVSDFDRWLAAH